MTASKTAMTNRIIRQAIVGSRRFSNYWWATVVLMGATGFLLAGISSYSGINLLPFGRATELIFLPQGIAMMFYGFIGMLAALYLWLSIFWDVGGGYNEFNQDTGAVEIFRLGFPGKNRQIQLTYPIEDVQAIRVEIKEGINPRRTLYLRIKDRNDIPLTRVGQPLSLSELENRGAELARFLAVPLEGL